MAGANATHTQTNDRDYIKLLASYYKDLPGPQSPAKRPSGVVIRSKEPNLPSSRVPHPSARPPAEHVVRALAVHAVAQAPKHNEMLFKPRAQKIIHPGKALALRKVKAVHLSTPHIYKVRA